MAQVGARVSLLVALSPRVHLADLVRLQSVSPAAQQRGVGRHVRLGGGGTRWCARHGASLGALLGAEARPRAAVQRGKGGREGGRERGVREAKSGAGLRLAAREASETLRASIEIRSGSLRLAIQVLPGSGERSSERRDRCRKRCCTHRPLGRCGGQNRVVDVSGAHGARRGSGGTTCGCMGGSCAVQMALYVKMARRRGCAWAQGERYRSGRRDRALRHRQERRRGCRYVRAL